MADIELERETTRLKWDEREAQCDIERGYFRMVQIKINQWSVAEKIWDIWDISQSIVYYGEAQRILEDQSWVCLTPEALAEKKRITEELIKKIEKLEKSFLSKLNSR